MPTSTSHHHVRWLTYTSDFLERPIHLEPKSIFQQTMPTYTAHFITSGGWLPKAKSSKTLFTQILKQVVLLNHAYIHFTFHHIWWLASTSDFWEENLHQCKPICSAAPCLHPLHISSHLVVNFHQQLLGRPSSPRTKNKWFSNTMPTSTSHYHVGWITSISNFWEGPLHQNKTSGSATPCLHPLHISSHLVVDFHQWLPGEK